MCSEHLWSTHPIQCVLSTCSLHIYDWSLFNVFSASVVYTSPLISEQLWSTNFVHSVCSKNCGLHILSWNVPIQYVQNRHYIDAHLPILCNTQVPKVKTDHHVLNKRHDALNRRLIYDMMSGLHLNNPLETYRNVSGDEVVKFFSKYLALSRACNSEQL